MTKADKIKNELHRCSSLRELERERGFLGIETTSRIQLKQLLKQIKQEKAEVSFVKQLGRKTLEEISHLMEAGEDHDLLKEIRQIQDQKK